MATKNLLLEPYRPRRQPKSDMNVVPYIDVMLVLLVIFMVTAPMLSHQQVKVDLPKVANEALALNPKQKILTLSVQEKGAFYWHLGPELDIEKQSDTAVNLDDMTHKVRALLTDKSDVQVVIRADRGTDYGVVVAAMAALQKGGVTQLGLVTEAP